MAGGACLQGYSRLGRKAASKGHLAHAAPHCRQSSQATQRTVHAAAAGAAVEPEHQGVAGRAALRLHKVVVQVPASLCRGPEGAGIAMAR